MVYTGVQAKNSTLTLDVNGQPMLDKLCPQLAIDYATSVTPAVTADTFATIFAADITDHPDTSSLIIRLNADGNLRYAVGTAPTVQITPTKTGTRLASGSIEEIRVHKDFKIAYVAESGTGSLNITHMR